MNLAQHPTGAHEADARWHAYDYAAIRVVPHVHLGGGAAAGVVLHARTARFLGCRLLPAHALRTLSPHLDVDLLARTFDAFARVAEGEAGSGLIGSLPPSERFHWLTAPRSAVVQPGAVRGGRTRDPEATLSALFEAYCGALAELADAAQGATR
jgi:hypothetical protein